MKKLIAIGGGEIGRPGYPVETTAIDKEIIRLTGKKTPHLLFVPTASSDSESYFEVVKKHFGKRLGCEINVLYLTKENLSKEQIEEKVFGSDIIYVGGGNTLKMMKLWRKIGFDLILKQAYERGIVLSGLSAGSICWFNNGISDSRKFRNSDADYIKVSGLGFVPFLHCPHYNGEADRKPALQKIMKKTSGIAIALDDCCAMEIIDDTYRIISSKTTAKAYKVYWKGGKIFEEIIPKLERFSLLSDLLLKKRRKVLSFKNHKEIIKKIEALFISETKNLAKLLPKALIEHVGGTSVPNLITKGDLDINIRVLVNDFQKTVDILKDKYAINQPNNWSKGFASFKDDSKDLGIQLTVIGAPEDFFVLQREYLRKHPEKVSELNALKEQFDGKSMNEYRKAKDTYFEKISPYLS